MKGQAEEGNYLLTSTGHSRSSIFISRRYDRHLSSIRSEMWDWPYVAPDGAGLWSEGQAINIELLRSKGYIAPNDSQCER
jgi:hypothetical protein